MNNRKSKMKEMTITVVGKYHKVKFRIAGTGAATINWGDETETETHNIIPVEKGGNELIHLYYNRKKRHTMTITGEDITYLECDPGSVFKIDTSRNAALKVLRCTNNRLSRLDISQNTALTWLDCSHNVIKTLDVSRNTALEKLICDCCWLTELNVSQNAALTELDCSCNAITALDFSRHTALKKLNCGHNKLKTLEVKQYTSLTSLYCSGNHLTELDVSNNATLKELHCSGNHLTVLNVSNNVALTDLYCSDNHLTELDVSNNVALKKLCCKMKPDKLPDEIEGMTMTMTGFLSKKRLYLMQPPITFYLQGTGNVVIDWGFGMDKEIAKLIKVTGRNDDLGASKFTNYNFTILPDTITITGENITHLRF